MGSPDSAPITGLLLRWGTGEEGCLDELLPLVERELRRIAHFPIRKERQGTYLPGDGAGQPGLPEAGGSIPRQLAESARRGRHGKGPTKAATRRAVGVYA
jgi:hypothetical protein